MLNWTDVRRGRGLDLALGAASLLCGLSLLSVSLWPGSPLGPILLQTAGFEADATDALALSDGSSSLQGAREATLAGLRLQPYDSKAWVRLAWIESHLAGGDALPPAAIDALQRSYDVAPYGPRITQYRITFILNRWASAPEPIRSAVRSEIAASWAPRRRAVQNALRAVTDREGRLAGRVIVARLLRQPIS